MTTVVLIHHFGGTIVRIFSTAKESRTRVMFIIFTCWRTKRCVSVINRNLFSLCMHINRKFTAALTMFSSTDFRWRKFNFESLCRVHCDTMWCVPQVMMMGFSITVNINIGTENVTDSHCDRREHLACELTASIYGWHFFPFGFLLTMKKTKSDSIHLMQQTDLMFGWE